MRKIILGSNLPEHGKLLRVVGGKMTQRFCNCNPVKRDARTAK